MKKTHVTAHQVYDEDHGGVNAFMVIRARNVSKSESELYAALLPGKRRNHTADVMDVRKEGSVAKIMLMYGNATQVTSRDGVRAVARAADTDIDNVECIDFRGLLCSSTRISEGSPRVGMPYRSRIGEGTWSR